MQNHLFVSYRHENLEHARAVRRFCELLRKSNIPVMFDQFFLDQNPGGPDSGWPKWCEDCATHSRCVLIVASEGWFSAYEKNGAPGEGLGAATEADVFRQILYDEKGNNTRIRLTFLHDVDPERIPVRLRPWHQFHPFANEEQLTQLIRWVAESLGLDGIGLPQAIPWPPPISFEPDLANRDKNEWPAIVELLGGRSHARILLFEGRSGIGKSQLLRQTASYARRVGIPVAPINFKGGNMSVEDVLGQINVELGARLPLFSGGGGTKTYLLRKDLRSSIEPVALIFDTYEDAASNATLSDWLNQQVLAEVETAAGLTVIVAGQCVPDVSGAGWRDLARRIPIGPITDINAWQTWVSRHYPGLQDKGPLQTALILAEGSTAAMVNFCEVLARS